MSQPATTADSIGVGPEYTYPDGRTARVPRRYRHLEHVTLPLLESWLDGVDLSANVVVSLDGLPRCGSGRYRKPKGRYPLPSRAAYYEGICRTDVDLDGVEGLVNPQILPDSHLATCLVEPLGYTCEVGVYGLGMVGKENPTYRPIARRKEDWLGGQIVGLDLDGAGPGTDTLAGVLQSCERTGLRPSFAYCSGSCSCDSTGVHDRIRVIFVLDRLVTDPVLMDGLVATVAELFGAAHAIDRARVLYGGRFLIHEGFGSRVSPESIIRAGVERLESTFQGTKAALRTAKSRYRAGFRADGASGIRGVVPKEGGCNGSCTPLIYDEGCSKIVTGAEDPAGGDFPTPTHPHAPCPTGCPADRPARPGAVRVRRFEEKLRSQCALWRDLVAGSESDEVGEGDPRWLYYPQLLHVFSNLTTIVGGAKAFEAVLAVAHARHPHWGCYNPHAWGRTKVASLTAPPSRCTAELCRHHASCVHRGRTIVDAVRGYLGDGVVELEPRPTVDLAEGERRLNSALAEAMSADDDLVPLVGRAGTVSGAGT